MDVVKNWLALACVIAGFVLGGILLFRSTILFAILAVATAIYLAACLMYGIIESASDPLFKFAAGLIALVGIFGTIQYGSLSRIPLQKTYVDALSGFMKLESTCMPLSKKLQELQKFGGMACALQGYYDIHYATLELSKAYQLSPLPSFIDTAWSVSREDSVNYCAKSFRTAIDACPNAFYEMEKSDRKALYDAGK